MTLSQVSNSDHCYEMFHKRSKSVVIFIISRVLMFETLRFTSYIDKSHLSVSFLCTDLK